MLALSSTLRRKLHLQKSFHKSVFGISDRLDIDKKLLQNQTLDEKSNLHKVCLVETCCKYQPCQGLHPLRKWWLPSLHILCKLGNHHFAMGANLYKVDVCNRFAQGKLCANSIVYPVKVSPFGDKH